MTKWKARLLSVASSKSCSSAAQPLVRVGECTNTLTPRLFVGRRYLVRIERLYLLILILFLGRLLPNLPFHSTFFQQNGRMELGPNFDFLTTSIWTGIQKILKKKNHILPPRPTRSSIVDAISSSITSLPPLKAGLYMTRDFLCTYSSRSILPTSTTSHVRAETIRSVSKNSNDLSRFRAHSQALFLL